MFLLLRYDFVSCFLNFFYLCYWQQCIFKHSGNLFKMHDCLHIPFTFCTRCVIRKKETFIFWVCYWAEALRGFYCVGVWLSHHVHETGALCERDLNVLLFTVEEKTKANTADLLCSCDDFCYDAARVDAAAPKQSRPRFKWTFLTGGRFVWNPVSLIVGGGLTVDVG